MLIFISECKKPVYLCITAATQSCQIPMTVLKNQDASKVSVFGFTVLGKCRILLLSKSELLPPFPGGEDSTNAHEVQFS